MLGKYDTYDFILINENNDGGKHSQLLVYNIVARKLACEERI